MSGSKFSLLHIISFGLVVVISLSGFCGWSPTNAFSFDGSTVPCNGVNITGYPKMKEQYTRCMHKVQEKMNATGMQLYLCTALCVLTEDELVSTTTGKLVKSSISNYKDVFDHMPEVVRPNITQVFNDCFDQHQNETVYNVTNPNDCSGAMYVGICLKVGIDGVCSPSTDEDDK